MNYRETPDIISSPFFAKMSVSFYQNARLQVPYENKLHVLCVINLTFKTDNIET